MEISILLPFFPKKEDLPIGLHLRLTLPTCQRCVRSTRVDTKYSLFPSPLAKNRGSGVQIWFTLGSFGSSLRPGCPEPWGPSPSGRTGANARTGLELAVSAKSWLMGRRSLFGGYSTVTMVLAHLN